MRPADLALARHHSYTLLGRLLLEGLTEELWSFVGAIPSLVETLPNVFDADEAAAMHQRVWGLTVFPFESIFLDATGLLGGEVTEQVQATYRHAGFRRGPNGVSADHVGLQLRFLAFLSAAEADAWADGLAPIAGRMQELQRSFMQRHLLRWLLPLGLAVARQRQPFYRAVMLLAIEVVTEHHESLADQTPLAWALPDAPSLLADERTGLRDIATFYTTPPHAGLFLSRDDLGALGRAHELPRGFGSRQQLMENLLRSASHYGALAGVLAQLRDLAEQDRAALAIWEAKPSLAPFAAPWRSRLDESLTLLSRLAEAAANTSIGD